MAKVWDDRHRYLVWLEVEMAVCKELAEEKLIPKKDWRELQKKVTSLISRGGVDPKKVAEFEAVTRHDVIAFTTAVAQEIGPISRYIHFGLTSSDVVDTSLSLLLKQAGELLLRDTDRFLITLKTLAHKYKKLPTIGRSHGIFAEPTSFGLKFLGWYTEWQRNRQRLITGLQTICVGKLSGAVGVNPHWNPAFEERVLHRLKLAREPVSTQVIPRDRHAEFMGVLALMGSSLERIAVELRHLQRSEVREVMEGFQKGQKGSSAMPHKRNPISSENITGCARLLRSYSQAAMENIALWHERDISHSSVERVILPDATLILDYALDRMDQVLNQLVVQSEQIQHNLEMAGSSSYSGHYLLELVKTGATREQAYSWVQECALSALDHQMKSQTKAQVTSHSRVSSEFVARVLHHPEISKRLSEKKIRELGSIQYQLRSVDEIYRRALLKGPSRKATQR